MHCVFLFLHCMISFCTEQWHCFWKNTCLHFSAKNMRCEGHGHSLVRVVEQAVQIKLFLSHQSRHAPTKRTLSVCSSAMDGNQLLNQQTRPIASNCMWFQAILQTVYFVMLCRKRKCSRIFHERAIFSQTNIGTFLVASLGKLLRLRDGVELSSVGLFSVCNEKAGGVSLHCAT